MIGTINSLNSLNPLKINLNAVQETQPDDNNELAGKSFQELLDGAVNDVNSTQIKGYDSMKEIATGKSCKFTRSCTKN